MDIIDQYGPALGGAFLTILALVGVVRVLWKLAQEQQRQHVSALTEQFKERLSDKNAELTQVWAELRAERDEKRRAQAENEWLERMVERGNDLLDAALAETKAQRQLWERSRRPSGGS